MENLVSLANLKEEFRDKKIFITGHSGFKGIWLSTIFSLVGAKVKGYSLPPEDSLDFFQLLKDNSSVQHVFADIRDRGRLHDELEQFQPDYIFHLAAQPLVLRSYKEPEYTFDVNVTGTVNLLTGLKNVSVPCTVVISTTDKVYENRETDVLYNENDRLGGYDPYSASKASAEIAIQSIRNSFFHPDKIASHQKAIAVGRAGNVIGGGDWSANRIVPDIVRSLMKNDPILLRNPNAIRPWQHVLEPLSGYIQLAIAASNDPLRFGTAFNFGPTADDHLPVVKLTEKSIRVWGSGSYELEDSAAKPHEAGILKLDITKAKNELSWTPKLNSDQAIEWTIEWYKQSPEKRAEFTLEQIENFFQ